MTLEDFFTLTEMKDGFTSPGRVEELITIIQNEKDSVVKTVSEATKQWAKIASTLAATQNKECLDLFIQLNGLLFIDTWLKDAQNFPDNPNDCFVEEAISTLLLAIEKLQLDRDKLSSSGIFITVESFLGYKSTRVQDKARALCDSWKAKDVDFERGPDNNDLKFDNQDRESQLPENDTSLTNCLTGQKSGGVELGENKSTDVEDSSRMLSNHGDSDSNNVCSNIVTSPAKMESSVGDRLIDELCPSDGVLDSGCVNNDLIQDKNGGSSEGLNPGPLGEDVKHETKFESGNIVKTSTCDIPDNTDVSLSIDAKLSEEALEKPDIGEHDVKDEFPTKISSGDNASSPVGQSNDEKVDTEEDGSLIKESKDQSEDDDDVVDDLDDDDNDHEEVKRYRESENRYLGKSSEFSRLTEPGKAMDIIRQTRDMDLEDGTVDALEVARLVANEVEREVGGYCEQSDSSTSSSSSDRMSRGGVIHQDGKQDMQVNSPEKVPDISNNIPLMGSANLETKPKNSEDRDSSLVTDPVQDLEKKTEKSSWEFDLNQEILSEDGDNQADMIVNPVSVVSASRAVVGSEIRAGPLQFEGSLGWKGSAATSAFRPASPRHRQDFFLGFDLNVAEGVDDKITDPILHKQKEMLPRVPSGESSVEVSLNGSRRPTLDLNQTDNDPGLTPIEWKTGGQIFNPQTVQRSPSPASSSSCMQPSMRNFDLNDNLFNSNDSSEQPFFLGESSRKVNPSVGPPDDTVISILGTKVKRNTFPPQTPLPFLNGKVSIGDPLMESTLLRTGPMMGLGPPAVPYPLGYNGLSMGSAVSLASAQIYRPGGPLPYAPFFPQMLGSTTTLPPSYCQPTPVMNLLGPNPGPNLVGPLRPNLDLNSRFPNVFETGNFDQGFYRPVFIPHGQVRPSEEQLSLRDSLRQFDSGSNGGKRKEPDTGFDFFPANYRNPPPH